MMSRKALALGSSLKTFHRVELLTNASRMLPHQPFGTTPMPIIRNIKEAKPKEMEELVIIPIM